MRKNIMGCLVVLSVGALMAGGCAKKNVVKSEEPVATAPAAQTAPPETAKTQQPMEEAKPESSAAKAEPTAEAAKEAAVQPEAKSEAELAQLQSALQKIYFDFDSSALSSEARNVLSKDAELLSKEPNAKVRIEGNCDERGSDEYNMALGERRAKAAKDYLVNLGVKPDRLSTISYGEEKPAVQGHDEAAWSKNRRDEFIVTK